MTISVVLLNTNYKPSVLPLDKQQILSRLLSKKPLVLRIELWRCRLILHAIRRKEKLGICEHRPFSLLIRSGLSCVFWPGLGQVVQLSITALNKRVCPVAGVCGTFR